jgi:hypothetical protein
MPGTVGILALPLDLAHELLKHVICHNSNETDLQPWDITCHLSNVIYAMFFWHVAKGA